MLASATSPPVTTSSTGSMAAGANASSSEWVPLPPILTPWSDPTSSLLTSQGRSEGTPLSFSSICRQEQNRVSARESRRKRKEYLLYIENRVKELEEENKKLHEIIDNNLPKTFGMARCHCSIL